MDLRFQAQHSTLKQGSTLSTQTQLNSFPEGYLDYLYSLGVQGSGFRGSGFRGSGFRVQGSRFKVLLEVQIRLKSFQ